METQQKEAKCDYILLNGLVNPDYWAKIHHKRETCAISVLSFSMLAMSSQRNNLKRRKRTITKIQKRKIKTKLATNTKM